MMNLLVVTFFPPLSAALNDRGKKKSTIGGSRISFSNNVLFVKTA